MISTKDPATLSAREINRELDKLDKIDDSLTMELILAGRASEKFRDTISKTDALSLKVKEVYERKSALNMEIYERYGGKTFRLPEEKAFNARKR